MSCDIGIHLQAYESMLTLDKGACKLSLLRLLRSQYWKLRLFALNVYSKPVALMIYFRDVNAVVTRPRGVEIRESRVVSSSRSVWDKTRKMFHEDYSMRTRETIGVSQLYVAR
jgi:hypothetical protein